MVLAALILLPAVYAFGFYPPVQSSALVLLGVATTMSIGCLCEQHLPRFCGWIARWGKAAFFIYVTHYPLLHIWKLVSTGSYGGTLSTWEISVAPFCITAMSIGIYSLLRRFCPGFLRVFALS